MRIRHKYTKKEIDSTYHYWKNYILENHLEDNFEILTKPDLVDVYKININNGNRDFIETIDRQIAINNYLQKSYEFTIKNTDLSKFDNIYREIKPWAQVIGETLNYIVNPNHKPILPNQNTVKPNKLNTPISPKKIKPTNDIPLNTIKENMIDINNDDKLTNDIFIVHGHNNELKIEVARMLEKLGLNAIILHEQANGGQTIIEKFEKFSQVKFAIVLLTDDDLGKAKSDKRLMSRARQNVILELGYFIGKLSRKRICTLYKKGIELPSDLYGLVYTPVDNNNAWKYELAKELKAAGYKIDMNNIV